MEDHEIRGVLSLNDPITSGMDSNFGRLLTTTAERVFNTRLFRRVFIAMQPLGTQLEYPSAAILPGEPPETEYSNFTNQITYSVVVAMSTIGQAEQWDALFQLLNIREVVLDACRTKERIDLRQGDLHENTLIVSPAFVVPENEEGLWVWSTGIYVNYVVTEPRGEE